MHLLFLNGVRCLAVKDVFSVNLIKILYGFYEVSIAGLPQFYGGRSILRTKHMLWVHYRTIRGRDELVISAGESW